MDAVWINFLYHPLLPLGVLLSLLSAIAFLLFLRGFLSGAIYLFTLNGNDDQMKNARIRVLWAFLLLMLFFSIWEMLKWAGAILTGAPTPPGVWVAQIFLVILSITVWGTKTWNKKEKGE